MRHDQDAFVVPRHAGCDITEDDGLACASRCDQQRALVTSAKAIAHSLHGCFLIISELNHISP